MMDSAKEKSVSVTHRKILWIYVAIMVFFCFNMAFLTFSLSLSCSMDLFSTFLKIICTSFQVLNR